MNTRTRKWLGAALLISLGAIIAIAAATDARAAGCWPCEPRVETRWYEGPQGPQGEKGDTGARGARGERGETGAQGPQGERGDTGARGARGERGETGAQGIQGERGEDGRWTDSHPAAWAAMTGAAGLIRYPDRRTARDTAAIGAGVLTVGEAHGLAAGLAIDPDDWTRRWLPRGHRLRISVTAAVAVGEHRIQESAVGASVGYRW